MSDAASFSDRMAAEFFDDATCLRWIVEHFVAGDIPPVELTTLAMRALEGDQCAHVGGPCEPCALPRGHSGACPQVLRPARLSRRPLAPA